MKSNLKVRDHLETYKEITGHYNGRKKKQGVRVWNEFIWLGAAFTGGHL
jgi:hypothetical protein